MSTTGQKPGKGTYTCTKCGNTVTLNDNCKKCNGTNFTP
jgi:predicted nucleic acid binding AN1-type Zn finger protein